eukprot:1133694-Pelagomonas_calceolata.AAC.3
MRRASTCQLSGGEDTISTAYTCVALANPAEQWSRRGYGTKRTPWDQPCFVICLPCDHGMREVCCWDTWQMEVVRASGAPTISSGTPLLCSLAL